MTDFHVLVACAVHTAKAELRERNFGDHPAADRAHDRLCDVMEQTQYPNLLLAHTIKRLGRVNALNVGIDRITVECAIRSEFVA